MSLPGPVTYFSYASSFPGRTSNRYSKVIIPLPPSCFFRKPGNSVPAVLRVILFVSGPLGEGGAHLAERTKVGVELESDHALVLPVVVTEDVPPIRQRQRVDGPAVVEIQPHSEQQVGNRIDDVLDRQGLSAASKRAVEALDQCRAFQPSHGPLTLAVKSPGVA